MYLSKISSNSENNKLIFYSALPSSILTVKRVALVTLVCVYMFMCR